MQQRRCLCSLRLLIAHEVHEVLTSSKVARSSSHPWPYNFKLAAATHTHANHTLSPCPVPTLAWTRPACKPDRPLVPDCLLPLPPCARCTPPRSLSDAAAHAPQTESATAGHRCSPPSAQCARAYMWVIVRRMMFVLRSRMWMPTLVATATAMAMHGNVVWQRLN